MSVVGLKIRALLFRDTFACHQLGAGYATGDGVTKDEEAARRWYVRGARRGDSESQYDLAFMLLLGEGGPANPTEAVRWLERAAAGGDAQAPKLLAELYASGAHGVPRNETEARRWSAVAESHAATKPQAQAP